MGTDKVKRFTLTDMHRRTGQVIDAGRADLTIIEKHGHPFIIILPARARPSASVDTFISALIDFIAQAEAEEEPHGETPQT